MADEEQLRILKQGVAAWNAWRRQTGGIEVDRSRVGIFGRAGIDLRGAPLGGADLSGANLTGVDLNRADLSRASLSGANLSAAFLDEANLSEANLEGANLIDANLSHANLNRAYLAQVNFANALLIGADLSGANLMEANLSQAQIGEANLGEAWLFETIFSNVDLSACKNIETIHHYAPSPIDIRTLQRSGRLPLVFLRGVGLPDALIDCLPSLRPGQVIQHYSCFISYSSKDEEFVSLLHADLQDKGVRCWFAPHDMKIGAKILDTLDQAVRTRQKVLLILSEASVASEWVEIEVKKALAEERQRRTTVLFPVRLDDMVFETKEAWAALLRDDRHIGDFRAWKDHDAYRKALERVLRDLRVEAAPGAATERA